MENATQIVGVPTENVWSICTQFADQKRKLTIALTVRQADGNASSVGRELLHTLQSWLESAPTFTQAVTYFPTLVLPDGCEIVTWYIQDEKSLFTARSGAVALKRQGKYFEILPRTETLQCVQGSLVAGDILMFGTATFCSEVLSTLAASGEPVELATKYAQGEKGALAADTCGQVQTIDGMTLAPETISVPDPVFPIQSASDSSVKKSKLQKRTGSFWLRLSPQYRKIVGVLVILIVAGVALLLLQQFILAARARRIQNVTAPLALRLSAITTSGESRMEKEKKLLQLLSDTTQAQANNTADIAIERELSTFLDKLRPIYADVSKRKEIDHLSVFYDFRLISTDFVASQIQFDLPGKLAVFLDTARGKIVSLSLEKKQPQALSINTDIGKLQSLTVVDRQAYLLGTQGIYEVSLPLDTQGKIVASASASWQNPKLIGSFAKNLYVFDPDSRQVWRYDREDLSASPSAWLRNKEGVELGSISSLSIDGNLWMGTTQGTIYKFTRGDRGGFTYTDIVSAPNTAVSIFTTDFSANLYVLEPRAKRIIVFDKNGTYLSSIVSPDLESATGLIVDEEGKQAYVLAGSLVYAVEL